MFWQPQRTQCLNMMTFMFFSSECGTPKGIKKESCNRGETRGKKKRCCVDEIFLRKKNKIGKVSLALESCPPRENVSNRSKQKKFEQTKPPKCCEWNNTHPLICHHQDTVSVETFICTGPWKCHQHTCLVNQGTVYICLQVQEVLEKVELDWLSDQKKTN
jgi:hypothetical protein